MCIRDRHGAAAEAGSAWRSGRGRHRAAARAFKLAARSLEVLGVEGAEAAGWAGWAGWLRSSLAAQHAHGQARASRIADREVSQRCGSIRQQISGASRNTRKLRMIVSVTSDLASLTRLTLRIPSISLPTASAGTANMLSTPLRPPSASPSLSGLA
eukprot:1546375-Rhodomonas_salina.1